MRDWTARSPRASLAVLWSWQAPLLAAATAIGVVAFAAAAPRTVNALAQAAQSPSAAGAVEHHHATESTSSDSSGSKSYTVSSGTYVPPDVTLTDRHGGKVRLADVIARPRPVLLEFIFTSCATICPIMSATLSQAQEDLHRASEEFTIISISIDPEYDTPEKLDAYARRYHPGGNWLFLTGSKQDVIRVLKAFDALYQSDNKMYHRPYTFLHTQTGTGWIRLEGFPSVSDLMKEYRGALGAQTNSVQ